MTEFDKRYWFVVGSLGFIIAAVISTLAALSGSFAPLIAFSIVGGVVGLVIGLWKLSGKIFGEDD